MSRPGIEPAIGPAGEARNLPEGALGNRIITFLEHESRNAEQPQGAGGMAKIVEFFLHGVADKNQRLHLVPLRLSLRVCDDLADLRVPAATVDLLHEMSETLRPRNPLRGATFPQSAIIDQLDVETADCGCLAKHVGLQLARRVPQRLPAHGRIEGKDEPAALSGLARSGKTFDLRQQSIDLGMCGWRDRRAAAARPRGLAV